MLRWLRAPNPSLEPTRSVASALGASGGSGVRVWYEPAPGGDGGTAAELLPVGANPSQCKVRPHGAEPRAATVTPP